MLAECPLRCLWRSGYVHDRAHASPFYGTHRPRTRECSVIHIQALGKHGWPQAQPLLASRPVDAVTV
jgi:hypothetical protein